MRIPFNKPTLVGDEMEHMRTAIETGHTSSSGPFSSRVAAMLERELGAASALLTTSCTDALEMTAILLGLGPGDKVIVPSFTFVSTALAYARTGAEIVFADIEPNRLGIDPAHVDALMDEQVKAVVPVHYAGVPCLIEELMDVVPSGVTVVEDNAHGLFGRSRGKPLGTFGRFSTSSFHETKNFVSGEGGALVVNAAEDVERARIVYDKGTDRQAFLAGEVDKYTWQDLGSSFGMSDLLAAFLYGQLEQSSEIMAKRAAAFDRYYAGLKPVADRHDVQLPEIPVDVDCGYHMFYMLMPTAEARSACLSTLRERGIGATFHYIPLHSAPGARRFSRSGADLPITDSISSRIIRLPYFTSIKTDQIDEVIEAVTEIFDGLR